MANAGRSAFSDPAEWLKESRQKSIEFVYGAPVGYEKGKIRANAVS
ncbi:hypothetical protein [Rhizobium laguerreae]|uniref:Uncharacterized protein n=1 Tax=Rhizobium laguerreae TaxID=1076926 RepID=A0A7Y2RA32_9HYPH|nr:hypothetical protein [Rhizobium laguerreae]NNH42014.1 hypothetical protein [Rhizobium laguerreae]NNH57224.1 hypothetical protein [Rhizobium laguerreae]NNH67199.1 hypothetical protein [Rhizobium laguerreae]